METDTMKSPEQIHAEIQILMHQRTCRQRVIRAELEAIAEANAQILALQVKLRNHELEAKNQSQVDRAIQDSRMLDWCDLNPLPDFSQVGNDSGWTIRDAIRSAITKTAKPDTK